MMPLGVVKERKGDPRVTPPKRINLGSEGRVFTLVSREDYDELNKVTWHLNNCGYAVRYVQIVPGRTRAILMARAILGLEYGDPRQADHINRDRLDNQRSNLRVVDPWVQSQNCSTHRGSSSPHRGVSWHSAERRWKAAGQVNGRRSDLGRFDAEEEAAAVATAWRKEYMPFSVEDPQW